MKIPNSPAAVSFINVVNKHLLPLNYVFGKAFTDGNKPEDLPCECITIIAFEERAKTNMHKFRILVHTTTGRTIISACMLFPVFANAQNRTPDTTRVYPLTEVVVSERYQNREAKVAAPIQILSKEQLNKLNAFQLSDAVKHFVGVTVKDYGGIGGLKTISLRSLGAGHTAVGYDGITLSDMQTGQIDIGRFSLENIAQLSLNNGQSDNIFQPARFLAAAGVLNIQTTAPTFVEEQNIHVRSSLKTGSWGLLNPSVAIEGKLNERWMLATSGEFTSTDGRYPYILHYGNDTDSTSHEKRKNTEVQTWRAEAGLFGNFSDKEQWKLKAYYYQSARGLPGAATLYYDYASQHLWDKNTFLQSYYKKELSRRWVFQTSAKWSWNYQRYLDPDYKGMGGETENSYYQQEYYLSASLLYRIGSHLSFSLSSDGSINAMNANLTNFAQPARYAWLTAMAGKYANEWITATASLLNTFVHEETRLGTDAGSHRKLNPYAGISLKPFAGEEWHLRAFYKNIFRLPNFNELYYSETGNKNLLPENTTQYNVGITYEKEISNHIPYVSITADAYYNKVSDKIIAIPTKNLFIWSVVNLGEVDIQGLDATAHISLQPLQKVGLDLSGNYTYQRALDVTDIDGKTYRHQIAYTPRIAGSGQAGITTPWVNISYTYLFSGKRYVLGQNTPENRINGYADHSLSANREFTFGKLKASFTIEALNFLNKNYEVVRYFPMPGRSVRIGVKTVY
ncbi:TonB-dependent receptor [termite gut metagenome]|uniref:TonB-dependent receptor n=1 Tax=termite gut metagenome TaxID=433724 RepID=A0A5J4S6D7_9ZZZZ